jgi:hypothetical protein
MPTMAELKANLIEANQQMAVAESAYIDTVQARLAEPDYKKLLDDVTDLADSDDAPEGPLKVQLGNLINCLTNVPLALAGRKTQLQPALNADAPATPITAPPAPLP